MSHRYSLLIAITLAGLAGCASDGTRLPTLAYGDPRAERLAAEYHDPLPEQDIGPYTSARPRGFEHARSEPRRTLEGNSKVPFRSGAAYRGTSFSNTVQD